LVVLTLSGITNTIDRGHTLPGFFYKLSPGFKNNY